MSSKRNAPIRRRDITVERDGKTYQAKYHVKNETVTVESMSAAVEKIATQVRGWNAHHVAQALFILMIDAGLV